ncbi:MAG: DoxX family protein [Micromonosporaceae bacterium]
MSPHSIAQPATRTRGRAATATLWVGQVLLAALFVFAAYGKLASDPAQVHGFAEIGAGQWLRYVTGVLEMAGAIGLLIPRLAGLAATGLIGIMIGAVWYHLVILPPPVWAVVPTIVGALLALIGYARRTEIRDLASLVRR